MDLLGDRMKELEGFEADRRSMPGLPLLVRVDGKAFSGWTAGLRYPFDERIQELRVATTRRLLEELGGIVGYCQSDEISLALFAEGKSDLHCRGRFQKVVSHAASVATATWNALVPTTIPEKAGVPAMFDARAWNVPSLEDAADVFVWREWDATKNSISMAARSVYPHAEVVGKNGKVLQEMLFQRGINWNDYPVWSKRGTYIARRPGTEGRFAELNLPPLTRVRNRVGVLFRGEDPIV